jgi:hypothetical protein
MNNAHGDLSETNLRQLLAIILDDWETISPDAATYLYALDAHDCEVLSDPVGNETAELQVRYFLANAGGWRGPVARAVKAELPRRLR